MKILPNNNKLCVGFKFNHSVNGLDYTIIREKNDYWLCSFKYSDDEYGWVGDSNFHKDYLEKLLKDKIIKKVS